MKKKLPQNQSANKLSCFKINIFRLQKSEDKQSSDCSVDYNEVFTTSASGDFLNVPDATDHMHSTDSLEVSNKRSEVTVSVTTYDMANGEYVVTPNNLRFTNDNSEKLSPDANYQTKHDSFRQGDTRVTNRLWNADQIMHENNFQFLSHDLAQKRKILTRTAAIDLGEKRYSRDLKIKSRNYLKRHGTWPSLLTDDEHLPMTSSKYATDNSIISASVGSCSAICSTDLPTGSRIARLNSQEAADDSFSNMHDGSNYYKHSLKMKDNRVKSTIRRHAIAKFRKHSSSVFDECAVDALTKEDLLVLWKRSEIELQTKLNKVTLQNAHLKRLLRMVDNKHRATIHSDSAEEPDSDLICTKL